MRFKFLALMMVASSLPALAEPATPGHLVSQGSVTTIRGRAHVERTPLGTYVTLENPYYNLEGLGMRFAASPRHADLLLVTGPVSRHMEQALRIAYEAMPAPKLVVAIGECGCNGGIFGESYASSGPVANVIPVDVAVPGCPPRPLEILRGILTAVSRTASVPDMP